MFLPKVRGKSPSFSSPLFFVQTEFFPHLVSKNNAPCTSVVIIRHYFIYARTAQRRVRSLAIALAPQPSRSSEFCFRRSPLVPSVSVPSVPSSTSRRPGGQLYVAGGNTDASAKHVKHELFPCTPQRAAGTALLEPPRGRVDDGCVCVAVTGGKGHVRCVPRTPAPNPIPAASGIKRPYYNNKLRPDGLKIPSAATLSRTLTRACRRRYDIIRDRMSVF